MKMNPNNEPINQGNDNNIESSNNINLNPILEETPTIPNNIPEKQTTSLEDNIIEIAVPISTPIEPVTNTTAISHNEKTEVTPLPEVKIVEEHSEGTNDSPMVEKEIDDGTVSSKGVLPVFLIFGIFIISIIVLPYISDYINEKKEEERNNQYLETLTPTPTSTATPEETLTTEDESLDVYNSCGTSEVFTNITIDYTNMNEQCFKVNLSGNKNIIKYIPAINQETTSEWNIYLGEELLYTAVNTSNNIIKTITISEDGTLTLLEYSKDNTLISTYIYNQEGKQVTKIVNNS